MLTQNQTDIFDTLNVKTDSYGTNEESRSDERIIAELESLVDVNSL
jgi:hypothetical protein